MKLTKIIALAGALLALGMGSAFAAKKAANTNKLKVVTTIFPEYDWAKQIIGEKADDVELTLLLNNGVDLHSYQPSVKDIAKIQEADIFVYVGGESDEWVDDVLKNVKTKNQKVINLLEVLGDKVKEEELVEGMQEEEDDDDHDGHEHHHHAHVTDFADSDVKDRSLSEWNGSWQSTYPLLQNGSLDKVMAHKAEDGKKTAKEYKSYYETAYKTDVLTINVEGSTMEFVRKNGSDKADYEYKGFYIRTKDDGSKQARFKFEKKSGSAAAPKYLVFSDHEIAPAEPEHFHLYAGNDGFEPLLNEGTHFPTYYPAKMTAAEIVEEMIGHEEEPEFDEHVWLSLKNAQILCTEIASALSEKDAKNAAVYQKNLSAYNKKLSDLDAKYASAVKAGSKNTLLFGDRFPFRYLVDDYGLKYYAAFVGCSAESEASFKTIVFLSEKVNELGLQAVCQIESGNGKIAKTVISNSKNKKAKMLTFDSLQSTTAKQIKKGATYLGAMEKNLEVLKEALK